MHLVPESLKRPNKERLKSEKLFKWVNKCVLAIQLACLLYSIASLSVANDKTFTNSIWGTTTLNPDTVVRLRTFNCTYNYTTTYGPFQNIPGQIGPDNFIYRLSQLAYATKIMIGVAAFGLVVGGINKVLFDLNMFKFQHMDFIIRKDLLTVIEIFTFIFIIVSASGVNDMSGIVRGYFKYCGLVSENTLPYNAPYGELYFSSALGLFLHLISGILHVYNGQRKDLEPQQPAVEASELDSIPEEDDDGAEVLAGGGQPATYSAPASTRETANGKRGPLQAPAATGGHLAPTGTEEDPY